MNGFEERVQSEAAFAWRFSLSLRHPEVTAGKRIAAMLPEQRAMPHISAAEVEMVASHESFGGEYAEFLGVQLIELYRALVINPTTHPVIDDQMKVIVVFQIRVLRIHPLARYEHARILVPYLTLPEADIVQVAWETIQILEARTKTLNLQVTNATVEWLDGDMAVTRFEHPRLGVVEREFERKALPEGAARGDQFPLVIELDASDRVCGYQPQRDQLKRRMPEEWEKIAKPPAPKNLDDPEEMARYNADMREYRAQTLEIQARDAAGWRAKQRGETAPK